MTDKEKSYKINYWKCFWATFKDTLQCWGDLLDNDYLGIILCNVIFYSTIVIGFPIFLILALTWFIKRIVLIKKETDKCAIWSMVNQGYVKKLSKQEQAIEHERVLKKQEKPICDERAAKKFKVGDELYTVFNKKQVIRFYVDKISFKTYKGAGDTRVGIREYWCNCNTHNLPHSKHFGKWRCRHNHNLFDNECDAFDYLQRIRRK